MLHCLRPLVADCKCSVCLLSSLLIVGSLSYAEKLNAVRGMPQLCEVRSFCTYPVAKRKKGVLLEVGHPVLYLFLVLDK